MGLFPVVFGPLQGQCPLSLLSNNDGLLSVFLEEGGSVCASAVSPAFPLGYEDRAGSRGSQVLPR